MPIIRVGGTVTVAIQGNDVYSNGMGVQLEGYRSPYHEASAANQQQPDLRQRQPGDFAGRGFEQPDHEQYDLPAGGRRRQRENGSSGISLKNNILCVQSGYDIDVAADSEQGFASDYNDLYASGGGELGQWGTTDFSSQQDWFYELGLDGHSQAVDPQFIDAAGADFHVPSALAYGGRRRPDNALSG